MNDTRVTARRLLGRRATGGRVEALVLRPVPGGFEALTRPARKLRVGDRITFDDGLGATVAADLGAGRKTLVFDSSGDVSEALARAGTVPLPPYVHTTLSDEERYQTVYARNPGSAAAPTAGLHFTHEVLTELEAKGVATATVTLDVGLDTFRPVASERIEEHTIHGEICSVPDETVERVSQCRGRIIAVGTTTVRTLETFATGRRELQSGSRLSRLFITPGYVFQIVDGMFTNFHLPKTTMLFMVSALAGHEAVMAAYRSAVVEEYRFLSFGDAMIVV